MVEVIKHPNLHILTGVHVTKILFKNRGDDPVAIGIEFAESLSCEEFMVLATNEVILLGGAINSCQNW
ncbi:hypothetical protein BS47DRAFT_1459455 [Hydnum rufescens UP504]|uniref:Glucose-methanol-choline oxidoreductase N-terminal domain-containing protein n=1 Tax=Hydnum rufescens UP504 TaxID=1448309 RepID=A0A9P6AWE9_9AGAM|nr:hypothetical protein BS47DRAFT_1459455 [Hydnum rufescens UP504]